MIRYKNNFYDLDSLRRANPCYDAEHRITQGDVDRVNAFVQQIEKTRSQWIPKCGDQILYTSRYGDYSDQARIKKQHEDGTLSVQVVSFIPFIGTTEDGIWCVAGGGPQVIIAAAELRYGGTIRCEFKIWGHHGPGSNGGVCFEAVVSVWEYRAPNPLYGDFTTREWRKLTLYRFSERTDGELYRGECISFGTEAAFQTFLSDYEGTVFSAPVARLKIVWCYRDEQCAVSQEEWDALEARVCERRIYNAPQPVKLLKDHARHTTVCYYVRQEF